MASPAKESESNMPEMDETPFGHDDANAPTSNQLRGKQGHMCCGVCCDVRRAVIIITSLTVCILLLEFIFIAFVGIGSIEEAALDADDDKTKKQGELLAEIPWAITYLLMVIFLALYSMGLWGAINYNPTLVMVSFFAFILDGLMNLVAGTFLGVVVAAVCAYPHWFLMKEIKEGIMTPHNYPNEMKSCCCT